MASAKQTTEVLSVRVYATNDLSFSAYLVMRGVKLINVQRLGKTFKFSFEYAPCIDRYNIEYIGSEISRYDDAVRKLKRLVFSSTDHENDY